MKFDEKMIAQKQLRSFGLLMAGLFLVIGLWPLVLRGEAIRTWGVGISGVWGFVALTMPNLLTPVYTIWMKFAEKLGWFNTRVILSLIFFVVVTPISFVMKACRKKPLHCHFDPHCTSYREVKTIRPPGHVAKQF